MKGFFYPQRVAVIGVSDRPSNIGKNIISNLTEFGFKGSFFAVGANGGTVFGHPIYRSVLDIPCDLDLAVILVRPDDVLEIARTCGKKGIKRLIISSGGFSEFMPERKTLERDLLDVCQRYNIRFIGPNCLAVSNMGNGLFLPFLPTDKKRWKKGPVGIIAQSGGLTMTLAQNLSYQNIGVSMVASIGNKLNVDEVDLLKYYLEDEETKIVLLYLEGLSRARDLFELAKTAHKPIIVHKANISHMSNGIAKSHTASLASNDRIVDAAFMQAGIIRATSFEEIINCIKALQLPPLEGNRIVSMSAGGGPSVVIADDAYRSGFVYPELPRPFLDWLESKRRTGVISLRNPLDLGDIYNMKIHIEAIERLIALPDIDGILYDLIYNEGWVSISSGGAFKGFTEYLSTVNNSSRIPVFIRLNMADPDKLDDLSAQISAPTFDSIPFCFRAMRMVHDSQKTKKRLAESTG